ncbi:MAG: TerB family tellurite resistance protein [Clostridia bacterium]|nr:TerB family tellurite resistance protein [Clostridia bacterium]
MDRKIRKTLQKIVNLSDRDKIGLAVDAFKALLPTLRKLDPDHRGVVLICTIFGTAAAADGKLSGQEYALIAGLMKAETGAELGPNEVVELLKAASNNYRLIQKLAEALPSSEQANLITLIAVICSIDNTISSEEMDFIESLF